MQFLMHQQVGKMKLRDTALARAKQFSTTAQMQIRLGDVETVFRFAQDG